jgi:glycosyltransferase involved in cell wall biosynthesis
MLVLPGDAVELTHAIVNMIQMGAAGRATMGAKARAYVAAHFALERMTGDTLSLYQRLIGMNGHAHFC